MEDHQRSALTAGAVALVIVAVLLAGCGGDDRMPDPDRVRATVGAFTQALGAGNGEAACGLLTSQAQAELVKRAASLEGARDCASVITKIHDAAGEEVNAAFSSATVADVKVMGETATATLTASGHRAPVSLATEDGEWRLQGVPGI